ncbi:CheD chemotactic sensory transduction [Enterovibrio norvegicus DSM 15893]|uniref:Probable chemoreceptor glutamine deamidase CheD n=2 Tax=Enterovibrio norvegicus TaxID=188144 RepID=A0A1I5K5T4_9GAMM|nr:chemotaxis protein CheB [Enterovibrio norvegicus]SFO80347.1 CheD chemotactic sensory transduction [Enterovibrio norvegicus DSM 15893]
MSLSIGSPNQGEPLMNDVQVRSGEFHFVFRESIWLHAVVGTCVTVCIWDQEKQSGGMCHYRLPLMPEAIALGEHADDYGSCAIPNLLKKFKHTSSTPENLRAWVIGGGQVHDGEYMQSQQIGDRNVLVALATLAHFGIPIVGLSVGGNSGRQIRFNPKIGDVDFRFVDDAPHEAENRRSVQEYSPCWVYVVSARQVFTTTIEKAFGNDPSIHIHVLPDLESVGRYFFHQAPHALIVDAQYLSSAMFLSASSLSEPSLPASLAPTSLALAVEQHPLPTVVVADSVTPLLDGQYRALAQTVGHRILVSTYQHLSKVVASAIGLNTLSAPLSRHAQDSNTDMPTRSAVQFSGEKVHVNTSKENKCKEGKHEGVLGGKDALDGVVLVGSSTGGVDALDVLLTQFPSNMPPICIAQHIPEEYSLALVQRLNAKSRLTVKEAVDGEILERSHVYFAPGNHHIKLVQLTDDKVVVRTTQDLPINSFRPSVDYLFNSAAKIQGWHIVAALLTGMGSDGAKGLQRLKEQGAFTLVQDEKSCVVFGMGRVANELGAVCKTVPIQDMAQAILDAYLTPIPELSRSRKDIVSKELR